VNSVSGLYSKLAGCDQTWGSERMVKVSQSGRVTAFIIENPSSSVKSKPKMTKLFEVSRGRPRSSLMHFYRITPPFSKFCCFWTKLSLVQICSQVQDSWRTVRFKQSFVSCAAIWEMQSWTAPAECRQHKSHVARTSIAHPFVSSWSEHTSQL